MPLAQDLDEFGAVGMELHGSEHVHIALNAGMAHVAVQIAVGFAELAPVSTVHMPAHLGGPFGLHGLVQQAEDGFATEGGGVVVAADAVAVEDRLHFARKTEIPGLAAPVAQIGGCLAGGEGEFSGRRVVLGFVATHAGDGLAGHGSEPTAHELDGLTLLVQRLDGDGNVRGDAEESRAVAFHRHGAEDAAAIPGTIHANGAVEPAEATIAVGVGEQAEGLHGPSGNPLQPAAPVDVRQVDQTVLALQVDAFRDDRRGGGLAQRNGFEHGHAGLLGEEGHVIEGVREVDPPLVLRAGLGGDQEVLA